MHAVSISRTEANAFDASFQKDILTEAQKVFLNESINTLRLESLFSQRATLTQIQEAKHHSLNN